MSELASVELLPTSFGVFKPVGWLMIGVPTQASADALVVALEAQGWSTASVLRFEPSESLQELQAMVEDAGPLAGFGYEITLLRRYVALAKQGYQWLLVKVDSVQQATVAAEAARIEGATLAVHYRALTVEDLI